MVIMINVIMVKTAVKKPACFCTNPFKQKFRDFDFIFEIWEGFVFLEKGKTEKTERLVY